MKLMNRSETLLSLLGIALIFIVPHLEILPLFSYSIPLLLICILILRYSKESFADLGFSRQNFKWKAIPIGLLLGLLTFVILQYGILPLAEWIHPLKIEDIGLYDTVRQGPFEFALMLLFAWLIGGFYEELVFHGFIFSRLEKMLPAKGATIISFILANVIFGFYHFQMGSLGIVNATFGGAIYLAVFFIFKRNLWYSICCHGFYNSLVISLIYFGYW